MRLDKLLGQGIWLRNQVKKLIRSRQVYVDGRLAEPQLNVEPSARDNCFGQTGYTIYRKIFHFK